MNKYEKTTIWKNTLGKQSKKDIFEKEREILRVEFENFRDKAKMLAGEISRILPEYTVHDIEHIDALWDSAEIVAKDAFELTPTEGFVLGGAFLLHDLGMGLASYPNGIEALKSEVIWKDMVYSLLKKKYNKQILEEDLLVVDSEIERIATEHTLRMLHARQAEKLANISWKTNNNEFFLIQNSDLRQSYGRIIGLIAYSHWWSVEELESKFNSALLGAPGIFPQDWTIDPLKLACIVRIADAIQIDDRRAPIFLKGLRKPSGYSEKHWIFQQKLYQPTLERGRIAFSSKSPFTIEEVDSWWICYDTLRMINEELCLVDSLLIDTNRKRLNANGVLGIEDPNRLIKYISVEGWKPVNASIKVSDVAKLVKSIGGTQLYGNNVIVPLRELIQNASDAIRARRILENESAEYGNIIIKIAKDNYGTYIEVEDNGIGMSQRVLTGPFLDFGNSLWGTSLMHEEFPGLETKGFVSTGMYGIGFFSVFMWGKKVSVTTRRFEEGRENTIVLEFNDGVSARPILRSAKSEDYIKNGGTRIRIWLNDETILDKMVESNNLRKKKSFNEVLETLCPSIDCNIILEKNSRSKIIVKANDWKTLSPIKLITRILGKSEINRLKKEEQIFLNQLAKNMSLIKEKDGTIVGRALIMKEKYNKDATYNLHGIVTVGGFRTTELSGLIGIFIGKSDRAARDIGIPIISNQELKEWASSQARIIKNMSLDLDTEMECSQVVRRCGGSTYDLKVAFYKHNAIAYNEIKKIINDIDYDSYFVFSDSSVSLYQREKNCKIDFHDNTFYAECGAPGILQTKNINKYVDWPNLIDTKDWFDSKTLQGMIIEAFAEVWETTVNDINNVSSISSDDKPISGSVGNIESNEVIFDFLDIINRPTKREKKSLKLDY